MKATPVQTGEIHHRVKRIYAAIGATRETDLSKLPPRIIDTDKLKVFYQDFSGGQSQEELENVALTLIHNIANFRDHLKRWAKHNGHDPEKVTTTFDNSEELRVIQDLSNHDKHGPLTREDGFSGRAPKLRNVTRVLQVTAGGGKSSALAVVTGDILDKKGASIGELHRVAMKALEAWEGLLKDFGISLTI